MLISDMYNGVIGLDKADVEHIIKTTPNLKLLEESVTNETDIKIAAQKFAQEIEKSKQADDVINGLLYFRLPASSSLKLIDEAQEALTESAINGNVLFQCRFNSDESDESATLSILYGKSCNTECRQTKEFFNTENIMDNRKELKTANEYIELFDKHIKEGDEEKARECIIKAFEISSNIFDDSKQEILRIMEAAGLSVDDLLPPTHPEK